MPLSTEFELSDRHFRFSSPARERLIRNLVKPIYKSHGAFSTTTLEAGKSKSAGTGSAFKARIDAQMESAKLALYWLLDRYLLDNHDTLSITATDLTHNYTYQTIRGDKVTVALPYVDRLQNGRDVSTRDITNNPVAYSPLGTAPKAFNLAQFNRIILVDYTNAIYGLTSTNNFINNIVNIKDEKHGGTKNVNYLKFEKYMYEDIAGNDPEALYIFVKANRGLRKAHSFVALTDNVIEYNLRMPKGAKVKIHYTSAGKNFTEYDDYVLLGLLCVLHKLVPNLNAFIISADNYDWFQPARAAANNNVQRYFSSAKGNPRYPEVKYYSPKLKSSIYEYIPHPDNIIERGVLTRKFTGLGERNDLQRYYSRNNFYTSQDVAQMAMQAPPVGEAVKFPALQQPVSRSFSEMSGLSEINDNNPAEAGEWSGEEEAGEAGEEWSGEEEAEEAGEWLDEEEAGESGEEWSSEEEAGEAGEEWSGEEEAGAAGYAGEWPDNAVNMSPMNMNMNIRRTKRSKIKPSKLYKLNNRSKKNIKSIGYGSKKVPIFKPRPVRRFTRKANGTIVSANPPLTKRERLEQLMERLPEGSREGVRRELTRMRLQGL